MGVTPEQLAEWRGLCEAAFLSTEHLGQLKRAAAKLLDALEAQQCATTKWIEQHDAVLEASLAWDTRLSMVEAERDRLRDDLAEVSAERDRLKADHARLAKRIELAGGYHARSKREIELSDMLAAFPVEERDAADHAIADLLLLVDCGRNRLHELMNERDRLAARVAELEAAKLEVGECPKHSWMGRVRGSKSTCPHCKIEGRQ